MSPMTLITLGLATFFVSVSITRLHGPLDAFGRLRRAAAERRGSPQPGEDWLVDGLRCPVCVSLYVAPALLLAALTPASLLVDALAVAGGASLLWYVVAKT